MKIEIWPEYGPLNSKPIFDAFIESLQNAGEEVFINKSVNADVADIWSVLWRGRMEQYKRIWDHYRTQGKPEIERAAEEAIIDKISGWFSVS